MSSYYIKSTNGRGVLLGVTKLISHSSEKEELHKTIKALQSQIDNVQKRILKLENKKD